MGNALAFLDAIENTNINTNTKAYRNARNQEAIDRHIAEFGTTKVEDYMLIKDGHNGKSRVNDKFDYVGSIKKLSARRFENRVKQNCRACEESFTPRKLRRPARVSEREKGINEFTVWCDYCTQRGSIYRDLLMKVGGIKNLEDLQERALIAEDIRTLDSLRNLYEQIDIKVALGRGIKTIEKRIEEVIEDAWVQNAKFVVPLTHYEFDF